MNNNNNNIEYNEISNAKVTEKREIVISDCSKGGFTIAQRMDVEENDRVTKVYLKGAFHIDNIEGLYNLRNALNIAISKVEEDINSKEEWD